MLDTPMHSMEDGIQYLMDSYGVDKSCLKMALTPQCWKCEGTGRLVIKSTQADKADSCIVSATGMMTYSRICSICCGKISFPLKDTTLGKISRFTNYSATGPIAKGDSNDPDLHPRKGETLCSLSGHYMIYQYTKGHRFTTDDVCTAYFAYTEMKAVIMEGNEEISDDIGQSQTSSHLDLGCGLGSVLLMLKWKFGNQLVKSIGIEAQTNNLSLAIRSILFNGLEVYNSLLIFFHFFLSAY